MSSVVLSEMVAGLGGGIGADWFVWSTGGLVGMMMMIGCRGKIGHVRAELCDNVEFRYYICEEIV